MSTTSFATPKGGVGKSTTCAAIGAYFARRGENVLIMDLDWETRTLETWSRKIKIPGLTVKAVERDLFTQEIRKTVAEGITDHIRCFTLCPSSNRLIATLASNPILLILRYSLIQYATKFRTIIDAPRDDDR